MMSFLLPHYCTAALEAGVPSKVKIKADEKSQDFPSAFLITIFIYSLYKSIQGRCARLLPIHRAAIRLQGYSSHTRCL